MKTTNRAHPVLLLFGAVVLAVLIFLMDTRIVSQPPQAAAPQAAPTEIAADLEAITDKVQNNLGKVDIADQLANMRSQLPSLEEYVSDDQPTESQGMPPTREPIDTAGYQTNIATQKQSEIAQQVAFREALNQEILTNVDENGAQWVLGPGGWFQCGRIGVTNGQYYYVDGDDSTSADWWDAQSKETIMKLVDVCHGM